MPELERLDDRKQRLDTSPRITELDRIVAIFESDPTGVDDRTFSTLSMLMVDAILDWDEPALDFVIVQLQRVSALARDASDSERSPLVEGRLLSLIDIGRWGMERALPIDLLSQFVEPESHSHEFLKAVAEQAGCSNTAIASVLEVDESEVSRVGRRLSQAGLARKRKVGRTNQWVITPRGVQVFSVLEAGGTMRPTREHRQLQI